MGLWGDFEDWAVDEADAAYNTLEAGVVQIGNEIVGEADAAYNTLEAGVVQTGNEIAGEADAAYNTLEAGVVQTEGEAEDAIVMGIDALIDPLIDPIVHWWDDIKITIEEVAIVGGLLLLVSIPMLSKGASKTYAVASNAASKGYDIGKSVAPFVLL